MKKKIMRIGWFVGLMIVLFGQSALSLPAQQTTALSLLKKREPQVKWTAGSLLKADFDYDGIADYALAGKKGESFIVGIVKGSLSSKSKHWMLGFSAAGEDLCSLDGQISLEQLSNVDEIEELRNLPKTSRGINLSDECDDFHIYFSRKQKQFLWWRN